jgi:hypothetical protein
MKAHMILGCEGRQDEGFHFCSGVSNIIIDLENIIASENYLELIQYLDNVPKIFDNPCFKSHIISNTIYKIYELGYISDKKYKYISHFYEMHKRCGLILYCSIKDQQ